MTRRINAVKTVIATSPDCGSPVLEKGDGSRSRCVAIVDLLSSVSCRFTSFYLFMVMAVPSLVALSTTDA